jgi:hypothetical protein
MAKVLLNVTNAKLRLTEDRTVAFTEHGHYMPGTLALYQMPGNIKLYEGHHWTGDPSSGQIDLAEPLLKGWHLSADYRILGTEH